MNEMYESATGWSLDASIYLEGSDGRSAVMLVDELKDWCIKNDVLRDAPDDLLVAFLHSCSCDLNKTTRTMQMYQSIRYSVPDVFKNRSFHDEKVQEAKSVGNICILPIKSPEGYRIILQSLRNTDPAVFEYSASSRAQFLTIDASVRAEPTAAGYVFLYDMQGVQMGHIWKWGIRLPRKIFQYLQEGMPLRMKRIHFLNVTPIMEKVMRLISPFVHRDLLSLFHFHTSENMDNFFSLIPPQCIPADYGGTLPSVDDLQAQSDWFLEKVDHLIPRC